MTKYLGTKKEREKNPQGLGKTSLENGTVLVPENCRLANFVGRFIPHSGGCPKCSFPTFRPSVLVSDLLPRGRIEEGRDMHMIFFCWVRRAPNAREHALPG